MSLPIVFKDVQAKKNYTLVEEWGRGGYGICFLAREDTSRDYFILKTGEKRSLKIEGDVHCKLKNDHVVQFITAFSFENFSCMILEPCENGSVELLLNCRKTLTHAEVRCIATQVTHGLEYLHGELVIHRDIKLSNLLLSGTMTVKIADFGLSLMLSHREEKRLSICGTESYIAPEVRKKVGYSFEVDIWALGCVVYTLLDGKAPFLKNTSNKAIESIVRLRTANSPKITLLAWQFLQTIFTTNPSVRPTAKTVLNHNYFTTTYTPERLTPSVFFKKYSNKHQLTPRQPLADITNKAPKHFSKASFTRPTVGKENVVRKKETDEKLHPQFSMSLRNRKTIKDLPFLENIWIDNGANLSKRLLDELHDIKVLHSDWELDGQCFPFTCVECWVKGITAFGYQINNGALGIDFSEGNFFHRSSEGKESLYGPNGYKQNLQLKIEKNVTKTLRYVDAFMKCLSSTGPKTDNKEDVLVVVKKCYLPKDETSPCVDPIIGFLLSNGSCQINYCNHDKLIVNLHENLIASWNSEKVKMCTFRDLRIRGIPTSLGKKVEQMCIFLAVSQHQTL